MKNNVILIACLSLLVLFSSCDNDANNPVIKPSDTVTTESIDANDFTELDVSHDFTVHVNFSETEEKVEIRSNENLHQYINVEQVGDRLIIEMDNISTTKDEVLEAFITTKSIDKYNIAADSKVILNDPLIVDNVEINAAADSDFEGEIHAEKLKLTLAADSKSDLSGTVDEVVAKLTGDSKMSSYALISNHLDIDMAGDCEAYVTVNESINVNAVGDCELYYKGDATIDQQNVVGDSKVENAN